MVALKFGDEKTLEEFLFHHRRRADPPTSFDLIALAIYERTEIKVEGSTVRSWCIRKGIV